MFLMIDNYDSFVYNLVRYFEKLNQKVCVYRNDQITIEEINEINPEGIIISPGPKTPKDAGMSLQIIEAFKGKIPIIGICLGHQSIAQFFGGEIVKGTRPMHGKISEVYHNEKGLFKGLQNPFNVTRYHSLVVNPFSLPSSLEITAKTVDGVIMGLRHRDYFIEGVQFHPEAELTEYGHEILNNFITEAKLSYKRR